jgi:hypothetical protein
VIDVQLEGIGTRLLEKPRVRDPAAGGDPVQGGDDGNADRRLHEPQVLEVLVGSEREQRLGREAPGLGERLAVALRVEEGIDLLTGDLLLVQRSKDEHGGARVLELPHPVEIVAERPGTDDQGWGRGSRDRSSEVHHSSFPSAAGGSASSAFGSTTGIVIPASCWYIAYRRCASACVSATNIL